MTERNVRENLRSLAEAYALGKMVRFVYRTASDNRYVAKVGTVRDVTATHVTLNDTFHSGAPRSCILRNIVSEVEVQ